MRRPAPPKDNLFGHSQISGIPTLRPTLAVLAVWTYLAAERTGMEPAWLWAAVVFLAPFNAAALRVISIN